MPEAYTEPHQKFKMKCFAKLVDAKEAVNCFGKTVNLRWFIGF